MEYRVQELASAAGVTVDTVRFYQGRGLIPPPRRVGRVAIYQDEHLERLRRIRALLRQRFTLAQIQKVLDQEESGGDGGELLVSALVEESMGARTLSRAELAAEAGVPELLIAAALSSGLVEALEVDGEERFSEADLQMALAGQAILRAGFPLHELLNLAVSHARNVQAVTDRGIDLFDEYVRKSGPAAADVEAITAIFQKLLPEVTRLVALHFQRTLVTRALERLRHKGESDALEDALAATGSARLEVACEWR
jgi:DNA-binding transcriptional MerR regulator